MAMKRFLSLAAGLALATTAFAQDTPRGNASTTVGGKKVTVDYGRPALKGRAMDELLKQLPEDRMWRAGDNQVTILNTEGDILIGGKKVPAGRYSLYVHAPATGDWSLALNSDQGIALGKIWDKAPANMKDQPWPHLEGYTKNVAKTEVVRAPMKSGTASPAAENFTVSFTPAGDGASMTLAWGAKSWSVDVKPAK
jgi:Protein of unknown function (DUF2911)